MTKRQYHSVSVFHLGAHCVWVLVFGDYGCIAGTSIIELSEHCSIVVCLISSSYIAADAHTDSDGLHVTAHLLHTVQDTSGQWCVDRVMERETLSNNTEYQERLREGRIKGLLGDRANTMMKELIMVSDQESKQLQQQVSVVRSRYSQYC